MNAVTLYENCGEYRVLQIAVERWDAATAFYSAESGALVGVVHQSHVGSCFQFGERPDIAWRACQGRKVCSRDRHAR